MRRKAAREQSPGSMDKRCRITSGEIVAAKAADDFRESPTEYEPPHLRVGKGEKVRKERTARSATTTAWQTPTGSKTE